MASARHTDRHEFDTHLFPAQGPDAVGGSDKSHDRESEVQETLARLDRLSAEVRGAADREGSGLGGAGFPGVVGRLGKPGRRRERAELEALRRAVRRWGTELERLRRGYEASSLRADDMGNGREGRLERALEALKEKSAELDALRSAAAGRELDLQREHAAESRRQEAEISALQHRLEEAGPAREEELNEVKRQAYERESGLRRAHAEKLSETKREAERKISTLKAQREADNRSLRERHADEKARLEEELRGLGLRRLSEARVYGERIQELARERAGERTSLEEAVAKLREKHEAERARLQDRVDGLEESLEEQEAITVGLLKELGYVNRLGSHTEDPQMLQVSPGPGAEIEVSGVEPENPRTTAEAALEEIRDTLTPVSLLREGLALFNDTEHLKVVCAISKSLGEPEVYVALESPDGHGRSTGITLIWPGLGWRRYVSEPRSTAEPKVYLAGHGEDQSRAQLPGTGPNARLDGQDRLSLGVRPL